MKPSVWLNFVRTVFLNDAEHFGMEEAVRGENVFEFVVEQAAVHVGDHAAGFFHNDFARSNVPRFERVLPEAVETAGGGVR